MTGGHQEMGLRSGTENLPAISALAEAVCILKDEGPSFIGSMRTLRDYFEAEILRHFRGAKINGLGPRISNTSNICFEGLDGEALLMYLDLHGVAASLGSACSSGAIEPSRVLLNMGLTRSLALSSIRFSLGRNTTKEDIDIAINKLLHFI
jgi:cysteine desulfurase